MKYATATLVSVAALSSLLFAKPASAVGLAQHVTITQLHIRKSIGEVVFVRLSAAPATPGSCVSIGGPWHFSLAVNSEVGKKMLAVLVAAKASGALVTIDGTGLCSEYGGIESMDGVVMAN
jgi:hypothetical protein